QAGPCERRKLAEETSYYCVCNSTYCDELEKQPEALLKNDMYVDYVSAKDGGRLEMHTGQFEPRSSNFTVTNSNPTVVILPNITTKYQEIHGFGGAMTDSAGISIASLGKDTQHQLIRQYFGRNGIGYTFIRVPFGGTDFSVRNYSYDDTLNDLTLKHFLQIPCIQMAQKISPLPVKLISGSWSPTAMDERIP
ncbi:hypothetical protein L9F63_027920, partial [Diploptera punctata]